MIIDLPVIISEDYCGFLEPQESIWKGESGTGYYLKYLKKSCPKALLPYDGIEGFSKHHTLFSNKTFFRFPLRNEPSKIANEKWNIKKLQTLLQAFKSEARYLLLFLRSVRSIEVLEISEHGRKTLVKVSTISDNLQTMNSLVTEVEAAFSCSPSYPNRTVIVKCFNFQIQVEESDTVSKQQWIVVHRVGSDDPDVLALAQQQHVLPWVGTAFEVSQCHDSSEGRIFCFLPLPTEDRAPFSVHVNGTFAVTSNRRSLNWESQERQNDPEATWNNYLLERCIPQCFARLVEEIVRIPSITPEVAYGCWPVIAKVKGTPWEGLLNPLFEKILCSHSAVYTKANNGQWISMVNAVFVPKDKGVSVCVKNALVHSGTMVVELRREQWCVVDNYYRNTIHMITPFLARKMLKKCPHSYQMESHQSKYAILQYCLSDKVYSDLVGLELIPLSSGSFCSFQALGRLQSKIFTCTSMIRSMLLPGLDHIMVDLLESDSVTHSLLLDVAISGNTQLTVINEHDVCRLLPHSKPQSWTQGQMEGFWQWLKHYSLEIFINSPIVPVKRRDGSVTIHNLKKQTGLVYVSQFKRVNCDLKESILRYGINLSCESDFPYLNHSHLHNCMYQFEVCDVLDALPLPGIRNIQLSDNQSLAMQQFLSETNMSYWSMSCVEKICQMKIFSVIQESSRRYSISELKQCGMNNRAVVQGKAFYFLTDLIPDECMIINDGFKLLKHLSGHVIFINGIECLEKIVFPSIRNGTFSSRSISRIMTSVLDNLSKYNINYPQYKKSLANNISSVPFVTVASGPYKCPSSLFDPHDQHVTKLYKGEPVFPTGDYLNYLNELRQCGLMGSSSITAPMIYNLICNLQPYEHSCYARMKCSQVIFNRISACFDFLCGFQDLLTENVRVSGGSYESLAIAVSRYARSHTILPMASTKPSNYPSCLTWKGTLCKQSLCTFSCRDVIVISDEIDTGSCHPDPRIIGSSVVFIERIPSSICQFLQCSNNELTAAIVKHFENVIEHEADIDTESLDEISLLTYEFLCSCDVTFLRSTDEWVWVENCSTFIKPEMCALSGHPSFNSNLEPFVYILPKKMKRYKTLLCSLGVEESVTTEQIFSVLESIQKKSENIQSNEAWSLVKNILEWAVITQFNSSELLIPIKCETRYPELYPASEVCYTDSKLLIEIADHSDDNYKLVHPKFAHLASQLNLTPLSDQLDITEEVFQDAGQHEPLTTRLSNILKEYRDGITIIKELIQNADDAEASEVNILYDARHHTTAQLLFKDMAESHGPALVVHNNGEFTEDDFANITKLAGSTKRDKPLKIGKFGVGFCSVYHITDVPSFISGDWLYIFDPTLTHLRGIVKNENQPGKRVKFMLKVVRQTQQLAPYKGLFGFNHSKTYSGTMFRLPFRRHASQISSTVYSQKMVKDLQRDLLHEGKYILLFLNHVKKITFQLIDENDEKPTEEFAIKKTSCGNGVIKIDSFANHHHEVKYWIISSFQETLQSHLQEQQLGVSSVACELLRKSEKYEVKPVDGSVFCFLPLSMPITGLPVHISANFAVMSNRSGIWISTLSATTLDAREQWNQKLLETVIPKAYCKLLVHLRELDCSKQLQNYKFYSVWPLVSNLQTKVPWIHIFKSLYLKILDETLFYSDFVSEWRKINSIKFLEQNMLASPKMIHEEVPECVLKALAIMKLPIIHLQNDYIQEIRKHRGDVKFLTVNDFLKMFFANSNTFTNHVEVRNEVLYYALQSLSDEDADIRYFERLFKTNPCVPCTPNGQTLKCCSDVVDPDSTVSELFIPKDSMFPISRFCKNKMVKNVMVYLGMLKDTLPWQILLNCAKKVEVCYETNKRNQIVKINAIIDCIGRNVEKEMIGPEHQETIDLLTDIKFLPVLQKPDDYILNWKGDGHSLCSASEVLQMDIKKGPFVVGTQKFILNTDKDGCKRIGSKTLKCLGILTKPHVEDVLSHFKCVIETFQRSLSSDQFVDQQMEKISRLVYKFLDDEIKKECSLTLSPSKEDIISTSIGNALSKFSSEPFVWSNGEFAYPSNVCRDWTQQGPYLFKVPDILTPNKYLIKSLGIEKQFSASKLLNTLKKMSDKFRNQKIPLKYHSLVKSIISCLNNFTGMEFQEYSESIVLPSEKYILYPVCDISYNDAPWLDHSETCVFVHQNLWRSTALNLGVKPIRSRFLDSFERSDSFQGVPFGQREELTQRIRNILRDYPLDTTFLKELLQNADDAKATKMYVILDKRVHGTKCLPSEYWKELQGPALLVWNDKEFTDSDLEGIQKLGLGSKRDDSESIGQFGIGFNVVYHITDCPSLFTRGNTICVFDPHCRYVPGATVLHPGRCYKTNETFWKSMADLRSSFLLSKQPPNQPKSLTTGSLFRFPLRHTREQIRTSKLIEGVDTELLGTELMEKQLDQWIDDIKDALLFLNHVISFNVFVIDDKTQRFLTKASFDVETSRIEYHQKLSGLSRTPNQCIPFVVAYPLKINRSIRNGRKYSERWFVQQGVGDLDKKQQKWPFIEKILPKHGIAASLGTSKIQGRVFCFLPLPGTSGLPVHINGQFILSSNRRTLWSGEESDERKEWNKKIIEAICSSYARFLTNVRGHCVRETGYRVGTELQNDYEMYYSLFPYWMKKKNTSSQINSNIEEVEMAPECKILAKSFFTKVIHHNCEILVCEVKQGSQVFAEWCCLNNEVEPFQQAYFNPNSSEATISSILETIGMKLTSAPIRLYKHLEPQKSLIADPNSVFEFYTKFVRNIFKKGTPCHISESPFRTNENFVVFLEYVSQEKPRSLYREFVKPPNKHPLLLTADDTLQAFKEVICSDYYHLFPSSSSVFMHKSCFNLKLDPKYFLCPEKAGFGMIEQLINANFPSGLKCAQVKNRIVSEQKLKLIWECIANDKLFRYFECKIVETWAFLPATNSYLYSSQSPIQPIFQDSADDIWCNLLNLFKRLGIPILKADAHVLTQKYCPVLSMHYDDVLCTVFEMHKRNGTLSNLPNGEEDAVILLKYFSRCNFRHDTDLLYKIKSLPLFTRVTGDLTALSNRTVYLWPCNSFCNVAYEKWAPKDEVVFLSRSGSWEYLCGSDITLLSQNIYAEDVYNDLIFKVFSTFSHSERRSHLEYIRDEVYPNACHASKSNNEMERTHRAAAVMFKSKLSELECLNHESKLLPISSFSDHTVNIFKTFPDKFLFLSEEYQSEDWMIFFRKVSLRIKVTFKEFVAFCNQVSAGNHSNLKDASYVLLEYLFSKKAENWYKHEEFMREIKEICFVVVDDLNEYCWIKKPFHSRSYFPRLNVYLTRLDEAAIHSCASLVWTIKPVVSLPPVTNAMNEENVLEKLGITTSPLVDDVYQNIQNISKTRHADFNLFGTYDIVNNGIDLVKVVRMNLSHLYNCEGEIHLKNLKGVPCIPVSADNDASGHGITKPVLVTSNQVVRCVEDEHDTGIIPYINVLPSCLNSISHVFEILEVNNVIQLGNVQFVLKFAFERFTEQMMTPNDEKILKHCVLKLADLLNRYKIDEDITKAAEVLTPLYLPCRDYGILPVSSLVFLDCDRYIRHANQFNLKGTEYSLFHIPNFKMMNRKTEKDICLSLPRAVRPQGLSMICSESIGIPTTKFNDECSSRGPLYKHFKKFKKIVEKSGEVLEKILKVEKDDRKDTGLFAYSVISIIQEMELVEVDNLQTVISIQQKKIGHFSEKYVLQQTNTNHYIMYVDSEASVTGYSVWKDLSHSFCIETARVSGIRETSFLPFRDLLCSYLKVESHEDLQELLEKYSVTFEIDDMNIFDSEKIELGTQIPEKWLSYLDNDLNNILRTQEWVGYEINENIYIWAMVLYPIISDAHPLMKKYKIIIKEGDEEGIEVSVLDLYKLITKKRSKEAQTDEQTLVPTQHVSSASEVRSVTDDEKLLELKRSICDELKQIWSLPEEEKKKALRRMCYKYHPDKASEKDLYEEAFKFLQLQIDRLEAGLKLDNPDNDYNSSSSQTPNPSQWRDIFNDLSENIKRRSRKRGGNPEEFNIGFQVPRIFRDMKEAERWLRQAECDHRAMKVLQNATNKGERVSCQVLFMAHEVMEKGLKAAMYALVGLGQHFLTSHNLTPLANAIHSEDPSTASLVTLASKMETYYLDTRFPNKFSLPIAPVDIFEVEEARKITNCIDNALKIIENIIKNARTD